MKTLLIAAVVAVGLSVPLVAQQWIAGGCSRCFLVSHVDWPTQNQAVRQSEGFWLAGWGFLCEQGLAANEVYIYYREPGTPFFRWLPQPQGVLHFGLKRRDVMQHYEPYCADATSHSGWMLLARNLPGPGRWELRISVHRSPYWETHDRTIVVVP
jgi:hypothetical protein